MFNFYKLMFWKVVKFSFFFIYLTIEHIRYYLSCINGCYNIALNFIIVYCNPNMLIYNIYYDFFSDELDDISGSINIVFDLNKLLIEIFVKKKIIFIFSIF